MLFEHADDIPSLEEVFGINPRILHALKRARFTSIVPVMMLPQRVLRDDVSGIGQATAHEISRILVENDLYHRGFSEPIRPFIDRTFGCIEDAPASVLQVVHIDADICTRPMYADLPLLNFMQQMTPHRLVRELLHMTHGDIRIEAVNLRAPSSVLDRLDRDIKALNNRIHWWDDQFFLGVGKGYSQRGLSLVHSR